MEGFEWLSGNNVGDEMKAKYPADGTWSDSDFHIDTALPATRNNGNGLLTVQGTAYYFETPEFTAQATWITGFAFYVEHFETTSPTSQYILEFVDGSTVHVRVALASGASDDSAQFVIENGGGTDLATSSAFSSGQWYYVEFKVTISDAAGVVVMNIDGSEDINITSQDTRNGGNANADRVRLYTGWNDTGDDLVLDDWYVCDTVAGECTDILGDSHIEGILPSGAGSSAGWTPSAGDNYAAVDDSVPDGNSTYVEEDTGTGKDMYAFGNLTRISANVKGVQVNVYGRNTNASTARTVMTAALTGATEANGGNITFSGTTWSLAHGVFEQDPDILTAWTVSGVNGAEFGMELVS
jgi:hypothetical protein